MSDDTPVMIAENVSVGILSLPSAVATLGMVPYVSALLSQQISLPSLLTWS